MNNNLKRLRKSLRNSKKKNLPANSKKKCNVKKPQKKKLGKRVNSQHRKGLKNLKIKNDSSVNVNKNSNPGAKKKKETTGPKSNNLKKIFGEKKLHLPDKACRFQNVWPLIEIKVAPHDGVVVLDRQDHHETTLGVMTDFVILTTGAQDVIWDRGTFLGMVHVTWDVVMIVVLAVQVRTKTDGVHDGTDLVEMDPVVILVVGIPAHVTLIEGTEVVDSEVHQGTIFVVMMDQEISIETGHVILTTSVEMTDHQLVTLGDEMTVQEDLEVQEMISEETTVILAVDEMMGHQLVTLEDEMTVQEVSVVQETIFEEMMISEETIPHKISTGAHEMMATMAGEETPTKSLLQLGQKSLPIQLETVGQMFLKFFCFFDIS